MTKEAISDQSFSAGVKSIVRRDFFPELSPVEFDASVDRMNLNAFCSRYISRDEAKFVQSIADDRQRLRSAAPRPDAPRGVDEAKANPWPAQEYSALFYEPPVRARAEPTKGVLAYNNRKKAPTIRFSQTRLPGDSGGSGSDFPRYHPFTTESSVSESESEFEGASKYAASAISAYQETRRVRRDRLERRRKRNELSSRGLELLKALEANG